MSGLCNTGKAPRTTLPARPYAVRGDATTATYLGYHLTVTNRHVRILRPAGDFLDYAASISGARRIIRFDRKRAPRV